MGLLDDIKTESKQVGIGAIVMQLPEVERDDLVAAIRDANISVTVILRVLHKRGVKVTYDQLRGYRRRMTDGIQ